MLHDVSYCELPWVFLTWRKQISFLWTWWHLLRTFSGENAERAKKWESVGHEKEREERRSVVRYWWNDQNSGAIYKSVQMRHWPAALALDLTFRLVFPVNLALSVGVLLMMMCLSFTWDDWFKVNRAGLCSFNSPLWNICSAIVANDRESLSLRQVDW